MCGGEKYLVLVPCLACKETKEVNRNSDLCDECCDKVRWTWIEHIYPMKSKEVH